MKDVVIEISLNQYIELCSAVGFATGVFNMIEILKPPQLSPDGIAKAREGLDSAFRVFQEKVRYQE